MECLCCKKTFEKKKHGFKRVGLFAQFKAGPSPAELIQKNFNVKVTPGKEGFLCDDCSQVIRSVDVKKDQLHEIEEKFRKVRIPGSYVAEKIVTTPAKSTASKRIRVTSTPKRFHSKPNPIPMSSAMVNI